MDLNDIARILSPARPSVRFRQGTVTAVAATGDLTVTIAGSAVAVAGVKALSSVCAKVGSDVWLVTDGVDLFAFGVMQPLGPAYCAVLRPTTQAIADVTDTAINFTSGATVEKDTHGMFATGSPSQLTVQVPGVYALTGTVSLTANATGLRSIWFTVAGATWGRDARLGQSVGTNIISASTVVEAAAGDAVQLYVRQSSGGSLDSGAAAYAPRLTATWLRGPT